jgi:hypothetical protein
MTATDWHVVEKGTLAGFFTLKLPSGLQLHGCSLHRKGDSRWVALPGAAQLDADGHVRIGPDGKRLYTPAVSIPSKEVRENFQRQALAAVDRLLGGES